jgi:hypothetical protein
VTELLQSSLKNHETRWAFYPEEALYFEKDAIFNFANDVQKLSIRSMIYGVVSMQLHPRRIAPAKLHDFLVGFDRKLRDAWLDGTTTLSAVQAAVEDEVQGFLLDTESKCLLSAAELEAVRSVLGKMTDVMSPQYAAFEKKVVAAIQAVASKDPKELLPLTRTRLMGPISDDLYAVGVRLHRHLQYNWLVNKAAYLEISTPIVETME